MTFNPNAQGRSVSGTRNILRTLHAMFEDAITDEVCETNPVSGVVVRAGDRFHSLPLSGAPARSLCRAAGWPPDGEGIGGWTWALYARFRTRNIFRRHSMAVPWSVPRARTGAASISGVIGATSQVGVLLGRRVGDAFGAGDFFEWQEMGNMAVCVIPHPSGRNLMWNDAQTRARVGRILRQAVDLTREEQASRSLTEPRGSDGHGSSDDDVAREPSTNGGEA